jgi:condensin complex subunit 1
MESAGPPASATLVSPVPLLEGISSTQGASQTSGEKDVGDVSHLSQLLFVVGHVVIKHTVFLELTVRLSFLIVK